MRRLALLVLAASLLGARTPSVVQIALPGRAVIQDNVALQRSSLTIARYPSAVPASARFPAEVIRQASVAAIPVYLPRTLPSSAPPYARISAVPGLHRLELTFTPSCSTGLHACHFATFLSETAIVPPSDARPITYGGIAMFYHEPVCAAYCTDGGLYFQRGGDWHAIEARGQLPTLERLYDTYALVQ